MPISAPAIGLSYVACTAAYTALGAWTRASSDARRWWGTGLIVTYVYALADAPLRYDVDYLLGTDQPYEPMVPLMWCLVAYLACDSLYRPPEWDVRAHHAESLLGLVLALGGYNVGVLNNCVLSEYSTVWLAVLHHARQSTVAWVRRWVALVSWVLFVATFVHYRIVPCVTMGWIFVRELPRMTRDPLSTLHTGAFVVHCALQLYWGGKIARRVGVQLATGARAVVPTLVRRLDGRPRADA